MSVYKIGKNGKKTLVEGPTRDHPEGNRPRGPDGTPLDAPPAPEPPKTKE